MALKPKDPLLAFARGLITVALWLTAFVSAAVLLAVPALLIGQEHVFIELRSHSAQVDKGEALALISALLVLIAAIGALIFLFLRHLRRIIDTVTAGDPFVPENAQRLAQMGWLAVATQVLSFPAGGISAWLAMRFDNVHGGVSISIGALLLAVVLFILARVFRIGTAMRDELEGTV